MAKNIVHLQHIRNHTIENNQPKLPSTSALADGELAVNYADGVETISLKNDNNEIVRFSSDDFYTESKLGSAFTGIYSAVTVTEIIEENEAITSAALNDLNENKLDASAYTPVDLSNYYTKSETSGKTEISTALDDKADLSALTSHTSDTTIHVTSLEKDSWDAKSDKSWVEDKLGSAFTGIYSAVTVTEALDNVEIDVDQVMDSGTSASTNAVSTSAVYSAVTDNELVWTNAYVVLSGAVSSHTVNSSIHRVNLVSKTNISNNTTVSCPGDITGATNNGAQALVIYENTSTTTDYSVTVSLGYKTPNGGQIVLTCPANGFCKVTYININGQIYASGN